MPSNPAEVFYSGPAFGRPVLSLLSRGGMVGDAALNAIYYRTRAAAKQAPKAAPKPPPKRSPPPQYGAYVNIRYVLRHFGGDLATDQRGTKTINVCPWSRLDGAGHCTWKAGTHCRPTHLHPKDLLVVAAGAAFPQRETAHPPSGATRRRTSPGRPRPSTWKWRTPGATAPCSPP